MKEKNLIFILLSTVIVAGCVQSPENLALANPVVEGFLTQHPNAEVKVTFFSQSQAQNIIIVNDKTI